LERVTGRSYFRGIKDPLKMKEKSNIGQPFLPETAYHYLK
jgi:hypothetical protein